MSHVRVDRCRGVQGVEDTAKNRHSLESRGDQQRSQQQQQRRTLPPSRGGWGHVGFGGQSEGTCAGFENPGGGSAAASESARLEERKRRLVHCRVCQTLAVANLSSRLEPTTVVDSQPKYYDIFCSINIQ